MPDRTLLAFDYGIKKIGVALGNTLTRHARPLEIIRPATRVQRFTEIERVLRAWQPDTVVVGLPLTLDGQEQSASVRSRRFANQLRGRFGLDVILIDERGSSLEAQAILGTNEADDAMAAAVILQRYLDGLGQSDAAP
ncbi:Holliday junction resolvase RuvX [Allopusillimonas soli]|uniref:Putative pre-16S rRNA nuclease n=1 Tax=Allopusillimonas soli TaxID=659016 RepID=A0A853F6H4_9BURK|nr:Holliday junction resolvase RuvX [Allopusillimonas soli]NYT36175.1 Holliday junction resolvase RuvX [Allopusillimonas soli]TEA76508.1 Holliday junction resolvase RuvX [Allopusillimonas soli]